MLKYLFPIYTFLFKALSVSLKSFNCVLAFAVTLGNPFEIDDLNSVMFAWLTRILFVGWERNER